MSLISVIGNETWALIPNEKHKAMEKKNQPPFFDGYGEAMKSYRLFVPVTKDLLSREAIRFDEKFKHASKPTLSIDYHHDVGHAGIFILDDQQDDENPPPINENQLEDQPLTAVDHPTEEHLNQEKERRSLDQNKRPESYGYDVSDLNYFSPSPSNIQPKTIGISLFSHAISEEPQQFFDAIGIPEWEEAKEDEYSSLMKNHT